MIYRVIIMKNFREKAILLLKSAAVVLLALFCLTETDSVKNAVSESVMRCLTTIIPSLYAMLIISGILINTGILGKIPKLAALPGKLLRMSPDIFFIYIISQFAGYPVGAKMLCTACENGHLTKKQAQLLAGVCYGAGPAFIFGCISSQLYSGKTAGQLILISSAGANFILALLLSFLMKKSPQQTEKTAEFRLSAEMLTDSILSGGRSMAVICFMITAFSVLSTFLQENGIIGALSRIIADTGLISAETAHGAVLAFLDVTAVSALPRNNYEILPLICALSSFGGVCVLLQISAVTSGKLSMKPFILLRIAAAVLSGLICKIMMPCFLANTTISAADTNISLHRSATPVPSLILIIMTFFVFIEFESLRRRCISCNK